MMFVAMLMGQVDISWDTPVAIIQANDEEEASQYIVTLFKTDYGKWTDVWSVWQRSHETTPEFVRRVFNFIEIKEDMQFGFDL